MNDPYNQSLGAEELIAEKRRTYGKSFGQCNFCRNYAQWFKCRAFKQIPSVILVGEHDHRQPYPGDNGIRFEPIESDATIDSDPLGAA